MTARPSTTRAETAPVTSDPTGGTPAELAAAVTERIDGLREQLVDLSHRIHGLAEVAFEEHESVTVIEEALRTQGVELERGIHGLPTAFRAESGAGSGPVVAVLAEYDALPDVGHGCGHNIISASAVGAFLGAAVVADRLGGRVRLLGTPAEETGGGKEHLARAGALEDVDAVVMLHPFPGEDAEDFVSLAARELTVIYHGQAAHASAEPHRGRNALDAVIAAYTGIAAMRQHVPDTDRLHGIITEGGSAPNVVPDRAEAVFETRSLTLDSLVELSRRVHQVLLGAARMTGTRADIRWDRSPAYLPVRCNATLAAQWRVHAEARGRRVAPRGNELSSGGGSTDLGNLSLRVPAIHPMLGIGPADVAMHTSEFAARAVTADADRGVVDGAVTLALTITDFLADADLRARVRKEFEDAGGAVDVESALASWTEE